MRVGVVGAGITGLVAAWTLQREGHSVVLYERHQRPGGSIRTEQEGGWLKEFGPNTLQVRSRSVLELLEKLELEQEILEANSEASRRYILFDEDLHALPSTMKEAWRSPLFGSETAWNLMLEPFRKSGNDPDETVSSFVRRRLGNEVLDRAINPFVSGIYAGDPDLLSVRHAFPSLYGMEQKWRSLILGSILGKRERQKRGRIPARLLSFRNGLQQLPDRLAEPLDIRYGQTVERVQREGSGWRLITGGVASERFDRVILNVPFYHLSEQLLDGGGDLLGHASTLLYPPLSVLHTGFRIEDMDHPLDGFGFLVPKSEKRTVLGTLFSSTLFPGRAPDGHVLLTTFVGGVRDRERASEPTDLMLADVMDEFQELLGVRADPVMVDHAYWPHAIPNYTTGYDLVLEAIDRVEERNPGVHLAGNARGGISVPDCIEQGMELARQLDAREKGLSSE
ncbi:MAG: protoporphyrinogen oxidase [Bacteroidota bacterium]